jgi:hypothetical protein
VGDLLLLPLEGRLAGGSLSRGAPGDGERAAAGGVPLAERDRERLLYVLGLRERERLGERDWERPPRERERERLREELWERERLLDLFLADSMSLIFLPLISFPDSFSRAFFRSL